MRWTRGAAKAIPYEVAHLKGHNATIAWQDSTILRQTWIHAWGRHVELTNVDQQRDYLRDVLTRLPMQRASEIAELLLHRWRPT